MSERHVDEIIFTTLEYPLEKMFEIARICDSLGVSLKVVPNIFGLSTATATLEEIEGVLMLNLKRNKIVGLNALVKRFFDVFTSVVALVVLLVPMLIIALLIKVDSKGPVFFKHKRIGQFGKPFYCFKFRTMVVNAEEILNELLKDTRSLKEEYYDKFKIKNGPRVTRIGKFLRKYSLDEIPQIFNVLKGDMSLIGPRLIVEKEIEEYGKYADLLLELKPGMTGLWVAKGRSDMDYSERVLLDIYYLKNWSL
jgi:lipopolysaccharide/colanic/teichoic acid biosynthesis glycosyltransferase